MTPEQLKLYAAWRLAYARACRFDRIPSDEKFAVFSLNNPHVDAVSKAALAYFNSRQEARNGRS